MGGEKFISGKHAYQKELINQYLEPHRIFSTTQKRSLSELESKYLPKNPNSIEKVTLKGYQIEFLSNLLEDNMVEACAFMCRAIRNDPLFNVEFISTITTSHKIFLEKYGAYDDIKFVNYITSELALYLNVRLEEIENELKSKLYLDEFNSLSQIESYSTNSGKDVVYTWGFPIADGDSLIETVLRKIFQKEYTTPLTKVFEDENFVMVYGVKTPVPNFKYLNGTNLEVTLPNDLDIIGFLHSVEEGMEADNKTAIGIFEQVFINAVRRLWVKVKPFYESKLKEKLAAEL